MAGQRLWPGGRTVSYGPAIILLRPAAHPHSVIVQARARQRRRQRRIAKAALPVAAAAARFAAGGSGPPSRHHRQGPPSHHRGRGSGGAGQASRAEELPGLAALNQGESAQVHGLSCPAPGDCSIGGFYTDRSHNAQAFVDTQAGGKWGNAEEIPGTAALNTSGNAQVLALSCPSPGACLAGGIYSGAHWMQHGFLAAERDGVWGSARPVPGLAKLSKGNTSLVGVVSCPSPGNCTAGGSYTTAGDRQSPVFVVSQVHGRWGPAEPIKGLAGAMLPWITTLSCASAGNCTAGGTYQTNGAPFADRLFVVSENHGVWGKARTIPGAAAVNKGNSAAVDAISCASPGNCGLAGSYSLHQPTGSLEQRAFVASQVNGTWTRAQPVPGLTVLSKASNPPAMAVSCPAAGQCTVGGYYAYTSHDLRAFILTQSSGTWGKPQPVPGLTALNTGGAAGLTALSCSSAGTCSAGGFYTDRSNHEQAFTVTESAGAWSRAQAIPGLPALNTDGSASLDIMSCPPGGPYTATGTYAPGHPGQQFTQIYVLTQRRTSPLYR